MYVRARALVRVYTCCFSAKLFDKCAARQDEDVVFENGGAKLVIDETSLDLVRCVARCFLHARYLSAHTLVELSTYKAL